MLKWIWIIDVIQILKFQIQWYLGNKIQWLWSSTHAEHRGHRVAGVTPERSAGSGLEFMEFLGELWWGKPREIMGKPSGKLWGMLVGFYTLWWEIMIYILVRNRWFLMVILRWFMVIYPLVNLQKANWKITFFKWEINYFYDHFQ